MRKLVFCFVIRMRDVGVGVEVDFYKGRNILTVQDFRGNRIDGTMVNEMLI